MKKENQTQEEKKSCKKASKCKEKVQKEKKCKTKTSQTVEKKVCFDNELYLKLQTEQINKRIKKFHNKLYVEFGGKIFDDLHAARVLPGYDANVKIKVLQKMKEKVEIIFCISSNDIEKHKVRADLGLSYDNEVLRLVDNLREIGLYVSAFVITLYKGQPSATKFAKKLELRGERVYFHNYTKGYPNDVDTIVSDEGYGANPFIETTKPLVVVTAPGPSSGKLATCLSQLYHEYKRGVKAGYAKFETFPVWNLPLKHPANIAYEAATADLQDVNQIDPFHFNAYGKLAVNYNRDIAVFPILQSITTKIMGKEVYKSPTDMGVNMIAESLKDDSVCQVAAKKEIFRRYYRAECDYKRGQATFETLERNKFLVSEVKADKSLLPAIDVAKKAAKDSGYPCIALELPNGEIVTGKTKTIVSASGAVILNALRTLANLGDDFDVITDDILLPIVEYRTKILKSHSSVLTLDDVMVALSICSGKNEKAKKAMEQITNLKGCDAHCTYILPTSEEQTLKKFGVNVTCEPVYLNANLFED
ncbi:MAG: DUF1846 domain-containing protein [Clostridia bacterium]|nr:DUF1846 domain-containing protein [Clostridia bacterium]